MKKYLLAILFFVTTWCFAQPSAGITQSNTDNNLVIQLVDSKLVNLDSKITMVAQSNKDDIADLKARTDEKLADKFKQLDDKGVYVGWWLSVIGILLTFFGLMTPLGAFLLNRRIDKKSKDSQELLERETKQAVEHIENKLQEADKLINQIRDNHKESQELTQDQKNMRLKPPNEVNEQNKQDIEKISEVSAEKPENQLTANDWFIRGLNAHSQQDYYEAISYYNSAIKLNPHFAESYNNRGNVKTTLHQYEEAIKDYSKAIELNHDYAIAYNNRGSAKIELKQYKEAITDYDTAIELDHNFAMPYNNRGIAKGKLKQYEEAIKDYDSAIELNSNDAIFYINRGVAKGKSKQYDDAIKDFDKAIELAPRNVSAYFNKACAYALMKNKNEALKWLDKALQLAYSVDNVLKDEGWKIYLDDVDFKNLIAKYNKQ